MTREQEIRQKINETLSKPNMSMQDVQTLALCWGALQLIESPATHEEQELKEVFPALKLYQSDHTETNLQKLCVEISEFCESVYASTQNERERDIFRQMLNKLKNKTA